MPDGLPLPAHAAHVHGGAPGGPLPDRRHPGRDAADPAGLPVGAVLAQPRRAHLGDGDRRGTRLHVPRLRPGPTGPDQRRHPAPPCPPPRQRPQHDRDDERAAVLAPGDAHRLLRRRDRDGRQHLSRRPQRGAHADAVGQRPQCRLLARQPPAPLPARGHRSRVPLPGHQRRGPGREPQLAPVVDEAPHRPAQALPRVRTRLARAAAAVEPQGARLPAPLRGRAHLGGRESEPLRPECRARPRRVPRVGPRRALRQHPLPRGRRPAVLHHSRPTRLLLVRARVRAVRTGTPEGHLQRAQLMGEPLHRPRRPQARGIPRELHSRAALVHRQAAPGDLGQRCRDGLAPSAPGPKRAAEGGVLCRPGRTRLRERGALLAAARLRVGCRRRRARPLEARVDRGRPARGRYRRPAL